MKLCVQFIGNVQKLRPKKFIILLVSFLQLLITQFNGPPHIAGSAVLKREFKVPAGEAFGCSPIYLSTVIGGDVEDPAPPVLHEQGQKSY